jgi:plastocyanin
MNLRRPAAVALALTTVIALGACTKQDNGNNTLADAQPTKSSTGGPQSTGPASGGLKVEAKDNVFAPTKLTATAGDITITVDNTGAAPHTFTIADLKADTGNLDAGKSTDVKLTGVKAGTYKFICKYHESLGMVGELTVG